MLMDYLLEVVATIVMIVISTYLVPWLKERRLYDAAVVIVEAAEQIFKIPGAGEEKFEYVKEALLSKFKVSEEDIEDAIEAAVYNINKKKNKDSE